MNKGNASKLWKMVQKARDYLRVSRTHYLTVLHTSYVDNLKFIKNKSYKDSLKTPLKLVSRLETSEINQMVNFYAF